MSSIRGSDIAIRGWFGFSIAVIALIWTSLALVDGRQTEPQSVTAAPLPTSGSRNPCAIGGDHVRTVGELDDLLTLDLRFPTHRLANADNIEDIYVCTDTMAVVYFASGIELRLADIPPNSDVLAYYRSHAARTGSTVGQINGKPALLRDATGPPKAGPATVGWQVTDRVRAVLLMERGDRSLLVEIAQTMKPVA